MEKSELKRIFKDTVPIMIGYLVLGFGFGVIMATKGYNFWLAPIMSIFIYAGSMQYAAVGLFTGGAGMLTVALSTLAINARHLFYGISMIDKYSDAGKKKPYLIFGLTDETYSIVSHTDEDVDYCFFTPGDQPLIRQASIQKLMAAALENRERIVRAGFLEKVGSPMGFPAEFFEQLCNLPEGKGGNFVALKNPEVVYPIMVEDEYELFDVDTVEDLEIVKGRL